MTPDVGSLSGQDRSGLATHAEMPVRFLNVSSLQFLAGLADIAIRSSKTLADG